MARDSKNQTILYLRYGPLLRHWTMRYEAKHNHLKKLAQNVGNFINVAWTLASRHQYWQCLQFMDKDCLKQDTTEVGTGMFATIHASNNDLNNAVYVCMYR